MHAESDKEAAAEAAASSEYWAQCLVRVAEGDTAAFRNLFVQFAPMVKSFAYRLRAVQQPELFAEELLQETMLKVWARARSYDPALASPGTWIFTIARNTRIDMIRRQQMLRTVPLSADAGDGEVDLEDIWFVDEDSDVFNLVAQQRSRRHIRESLQQLPPEQSYVLKKVYLEDKSHVEVAEEMNIPLGTVKSRVRMALNKLKLLVDR